MKDMLADKAGVREIGQRGEVSPLAVVGECLERIHTRNGELNAFITVLSDDVRKLARGLEKEIQEGRWRGPLHGILIGTKDFCETAGVRTTAAFDRFRN